MLELLGNLIILTFIGAIVAFNPLLIMMDLVIVLKSPRPILNSLILGSGVVAAVFIIFVIASQIVTANYSLEIANIRSRLDMPPYFDIVAGLVLLYYSAKLFLTRKGEMYIPKRKEITVPDKPLALFVFAFFKSLLSLTNIFAAIVIARMSISNEWGLLPGAVALLWAVFVGVVPFLVLCYMRITGKTTLKSIDERINALLKRDTRLVVPALFSAIGMFFLLNGILGL